MGTPNTSLFDTQLFGGAGLSSGSVLISDLLYTALRIAGVLGAAGRGGGPSEISDAFNSLNTMLDAWNTERLTVYAIQRNVFTLTPGKQTYQIGATAADFVIPRPSKIEAAGSISLAAAQPLEQGMEPLTVQQWAAIPIKSVSSALPTRFYYDRAQPIGNINLWPIPSLANQIALYVWQTFAAFASTSDRVSLAPGYLRAIEYNLAAELWGRFPRSVLQSAQVSHMMERAAETKGWIKALNTPFIDLKCDAATLSQRWPSFNYLTGQ